MAFTAREYRAIFRVGQHHGYRLKLCRKPYVYYQDGKKQISVKIRDIVRQYDSLLLEERRLKAQHARYERRGLTR